MEQQHLRYAGFWKRFLAALIDGILLSIVNFIVILPILAMFGLGASAALESSTMMDGNFENYDPEMQQGIMAGIFALLAVYFVATIFLAIVAWLYFAIMESKKGATLGKMALGMKVVDMNGNSISFGKATGRYFGKIISGMILYIGFIMAAFTEKKQALHDIMAGCLIVEK